MYVVYILESLSSGRFYVGHTNDIERRILEHNHINQSGFTVGHRPWQIVARIEAGEDRKNALRIEKYIKSRKSKDFIKLIVQKQYDTDFVEYLFMKSGCHDIGN